MPLSNRKEREKEDRSYRVLKQKGRVKIVQANDSNEKRVKRYDYVIKSNRAKVNIISYYHDLREPHLLGECTK